MSYEDARTSLNDLNAIMGCVFGALIGVNAEAIELGFKAGIFASFLYCIVLFLLFIRRWGELVSHDSTKSQSRPEFIRVLLMSIPCVFLGHFSGIISGFSVFWLLLIWVMVSITIVKFTNEAK